ncbi:hypothetical protein NL676_007826 [Syzygium grande]|nr:hypothetical protein NL676_007826 [Syzygium grande]
MSQALIAVAFDLRPPIPTSAVASTSPRAARSQTSPSSIASLCLPVRPPPRGGRGPWPGKADYQSDHKFTITPSSVTGALVTKIIVDEPCPGLKTIFSFKVPDQRSSQVCHLTAKQATSPNAMLTSASQLLT